MELLSQVFYLQLIKNDYLKVNMIIGLFVIKMYTFI